MNRDEYESYEEDFEEEEELEVETVKPTKPIYKNFYFYVGMVLLLLAIFVSTPKPAMREITMSGEMMRYREITRKYEEQIKTETDWVLPWSSRAKLEIIYDRSLGINPYSEENWVVRADLGRPGEYVVFPFNRLRFSNLRDTARGYEGILVPTPDSTITYTTKYGSPSNEGFKTSLIKAEPAHVVFMCKTIHNMIKGTNIETFDKKDFWTSMYKSDPYNAQYLAEVDGVGEYMKGIADEVEKGYEEAYQKYLEEEEAYQKSLVEEVEKEDDVDEEDETENGEDEQTEETEVEEEQNESEEE